MPRIVTADRYPPSLPRIVAADRYRPSLRRIVAADRCRGSLPQIVTAARDFFRRSIAGTLRHMLIERLSDEARRIIFEEAEHLAAARAAIAKLSNVAAQQICYVDLETMLARGAVDASRAACGVAAAESSQNPITIAIEPSSTEATPTGATPTSITARSIEPAPSDPSLATMTTIDPASSDPTSSDRPTSSSMSTPTTAIDPMQIETAARATTATFATLNDPRSIEAASSDQASIDPASTEPLSMGDLIAIDLPFAQAKQRAIAAFEREYLCRVMTVAKDITAAAKLAGGRSPAFASWTAIYAISRSRPRCSAMRSRICSVRVPSTSASWRSSSVCPELDAGRCLAAGEAARHHGHKGREHERWDRDMSNLVSEVTHLTWR